MNSIPSKDTVNPRSPSPRIAADGTEYDLSTNWGGMLTALCLAPVVCFTLFNPISLFIEFWLFFWMIVISFIPKFVYFVALEIEIMRGKGQAFYESHHTLRARTASTGLMKMIVEYASIFGGVQATSHSQVSVLKSNQPAPTLVDRITVFPFYICGDFARHTWTFLDEFQRNALRWFALSVLARLYNRTRRA
mmetsp:Transcript_45752/g.121564  ORF Transcript_45752/g.121564 Transcript_45752/m.121564 type:complete len:192 (+) Transcript_45752:2-577(+)